VERKESDLEWLHSELTEQYPHCIIPPLPEKSKSLFQGTLLHFHFSILDSIVDPESHRILKLRSLNRCLDGIASHPILCNSNALKSFLQLDEQVIFFGKLIRSKI
jgi:hypothetical protein